MEVASVLVDEIVTSPNRASASVCATLYDFETPQWVTPHADRGGTPVGPFGLVKMSGPQGSETLAPVKARHFGSRALDVDASTGTVSYRETWTTPPNCLYSLVLPCDYVAAQLTAEREGVRYKDQFDTGVMSDSRLFHYLILMGERGTLKVEARLKYDPSERASVGKNAQTVEATARYADLRTRVRDGVLSSEFWFKLLEAGAKLHGAP